MTDYVQNLNSLASVTSLSQLKMDGEGQLEKRSALGTLGHRIMDAFRSLSAEGRSSMIARNGELLSAMQKAVDESMHHEVSLAREAGAKLSSALDRLSDANSACYQALLKNGIMRDPRVAALPEASRQGLQYGLDSLARELPRTEWRGQMNFLRDTFLGVEPEGFSLERGVQKFGSSLPATFLSLSDSLDKHGFHNVFYRDMERGSVKSIGGTPVNGVQIKAQLPDPAVHQSMYRAILSNFLADSAPGKADDDLRFLPFLAAVCTQNGTSSACPLLARDCGHDFLKTFFAAGIIAPIGLTGHSTVIDRAPDNPRHILIRSEASQTYAPAEGGASPALRLEASITMRIDLDGEFTEKEVNGKTVFLPSFTLENASTRFTTEGL